MEIRHCPMLLLLLLSSPVLVHYLLLNYCQLSCVVTTVNCKNKSFQTNFFLFFSRFHSVSVDYGRQHHRFVSVIRYQTIWKNLPLHSCRFRNSQHYYWCCRPSFRSSKTLGREEKRREMKINGISFVSNDDFD